MLEAACQEMTSMGESLTFRCDRLSPAGQVCNTFMWAFNFHNAFHKLPFASLQKDFFNLGFASFSLGKGVSTIVHEHFQPPTEGRGTIKETTDQY